MSIALAALAIALCGSGLVAVGFPERATSGRERLFRVTAALALGIGAWSAAWAASLLLFGRHEGVRFSKDAVLAFVGALLLWLRRGRPLGRGAPGAATPKGLAPIFAALCLLCAGVFVEHTLHWPDGAYDAWMIWNLRARFLAHAADFRSAFSPDLLHWVHQDYPWLLPGAVAQGFLALGRESPLVPQAVSAGFAALALATVGLALACLRGPRYGLLGGIALAATPCFASYIAYQQADLPLATYLALAAALLIFALEQPQKPWPLFALAGFAAGLGAWTKNEGLLYALCLGAALLVRVRSARQIAAFAAGFVPCAILLAAFKLTIAPPNDLLDPNVSEGLLSRLSDAHRWAELFVVVPRRIVYFQEVGLWVLGEIAALAVLMRKRHRPGPVGLGLMLSAAALAPVYVLQRLPLAWMVRSSSDRVFIHLWPAALIATLAALAGRPEGRTNATAVRRGY